MLWLTCDTSLKIRSFAKKYEIKNTGMRDLYGKFDQNVNNEGVSPLYKDVIFGGSMFVVSLSAFK